MARIGWDRWCGVARVGTVPLLFIGLVGVLSVPASATDGPYHGCRARVERVLDSDFVGAVAAERAVHLAFDFRIDTLYTAEIGSEAFTVPLDHEQFWDAPVPMVQIQASHGFGYRFHPIHRYRRFHNGIDVSLPTGTPIAAFADGTVVIAGFYGGYGRTVVVDHGDGFSTLSAHMSSISVQVGDVVEPGATLGAVGSTGQSTGPHLHFETRLGGVPVNPAWFIPVLEPPIAADLSSVRDTVAESAVVAPNRSAQFQIERLYLIAFGRQPDAASVGHWVSQCALGLSLSTIAEHLAASPEFGDGLGALDDAAFVRTVFERGLGRAPSTRELHEALTLLADGFGRGRILADISESTDHQSVAAATLVDPSVRRLYLGVLGRQPDAGGAYYWTARSASGESLEDLAAAMGASPEYEQRFGQTSDRAFVAQIYSLVFGREPDAAGLAFWAEQVSVRGRWSVLVGFTESSEGQRILG